MNKTTSSIFLSAMVAAMSGHQVYPPIPSVRSEVPQSEQDRRIGAAQAKRDRKNLKRLRDMN